MHPCFVEKPINDRPYVIGADTAGSGADYFTAKVYDSNGNLIQTHPELTFEIMNSLNSNPEVSRVHVEGNIPFVTADDVLKWMEKIDKALKTLEAAREAVQKEQTTSTKKVRGKSEIGMYEQPAS